MDRNLHYNMNPRECHDDIFSFEYTNKHDLFEPTKLDHEIEYVKNTEPTAIK